MDLGTLSCVGEFSYQSTKVMNYWILRDARKLLLAVKTTWLKTIPSHQLQACTETLRTWKFLYANQSTPNRNSS